MHLFNNWFHICLVKYVNSFPASGDFCHLLITIANKLGPRSGPVGPDLDPKRLALIDCFEMFVINKVSRRHQMYEKLPSMQS